MLTSSRDNKQGGKSGIYPSFQRFYFAVSSPTPSFSLTTSTKKERLITPARNAGELKLLLKSRQRTMCCKCCTSCQCLPRQSKAISDRLKEERELSNDNNNHHVKSELELRWLTHPPPPPQTYNPLILSKLPPPPPCTIPLSCSL